MQRRSRSSKHRPNLQRRARLSLEHRFAIIEDDYDHEFHYEGKPVLPIASGTARGNVVYVASMANLLTPGLGTSFVLAPPPVLQRLTALRAACDAQGDAAVECAIAELFEDGELLRQCDACGACRDRIIGHRAGPRRQAPRA